MGSLIDDDDDDDDQLRTQDFRSGGGGLGPKPPRQLMAVGALGGGVGGSGRCPPML